MGQMDEACNSQQRNRERNAQMAHMHYHLHSKRQEEITCVYFEFKSSSLNLETTFDQTILPVICLAALWSSPGSL